MRKRNRVVAWIVALALLVTMMVPSLAVSAAEPDTTIQNLMVDNVTNPIGIDNKTPYFSWNMQSSVVGQKQTAYQIVVEKWNTVNDKAEKTVWDTGKVSSDVSIDIAYAGEALQSSSTYHWHVTVWDKDDKSVVSDAATFEMGLLEENAFDDVHWIRMPKAGDPDPDAPEQVADTSVYTIESNFKFNDAVGFVFAGTDKTHFYMWQLNNNMENGVEGSYIRPHVWNGGGALFNPENVGNFNGYKLDQDLVNGQTYNFKLVVDTENKTVTTYLDGQEVNKMNTGDANLSYGKLGFRQATNPAQGFVEEAWIDDLKATAKDGTILFYQDFSLASDTQFDGGEVVDGQLHVKCEDDNVQSDKVFFEKDTENYYRFDVDFTINSGKAGIMYGSNAAGSVYYYSQINPSYTGTLNGVNYNNEPAVVQNLKDGSAAAYGFDGGKITNVAQDDFIGKQHHVTVIANYGKQVWIYVDGVEAKYHDRLEDFSFDGKIGFTSDADDDVTYDNVCVKIDGQPQVLTDFSTEENIFDNGTVKDGTLNVAGATNAFLTGTLTGTEPVEPEPAEPVHFTYEADLTITGDAAGLVFSGTDSNNFYMWQLNGVDHDGQLYLRPHIWANGTANYNGYEVDISQYFDFATEIQNKQIHVKLDVTNDAVVTYINDVKVNTFDLTGKPGTMVDGCVGFRSGAKGETFKADNLKVVSYDAEGTETVKYDYNFDDGINPFGGSAGQASSSQIVDGQFVVAENAGVLMTKDLSKLGMPMFRKSFDTAAEKEVVSAKVYASSLGVYDLYVNGERVGYTNADGEKMYDEMKPGWTDYNERILYYSHDITDLVKQHGSNVILATMGSGWWTGRVSYGTYGYKDMAFMAKTIITYSDGSQEVINTDSSWKTSKNGVIREADIWDGETYDANYPSPAEISTSDYVEDESWQKPSYSTDFRGIISAQTGQTIQVRKELERTSAKTTVYEGTVDNGSDYGKINVVKDDYAANDKIELKKGQTAIFDLGQNMVGWPNINITAPQGTEVVMHFAEMLNDSGEKSRGNDGPEGGLYTANYRSAKATGTYIAKGDANESYRSTFTFYGFRYVSVTATQDITINSFVAEVVGSAIPETGTLETSDASVNQLISNVLWGQRSNYLSVPTDCPQRDEKLGWSGDTQIFVGAASYNANVAGFFHKWAYDAQDSQQGGAYTDTIPRSAAVGAGNAAWGDAGIIVPYTMYKMYGDTLMIEKMYDSMTEYMQWLEARGYIGAGTGYGDWLAYESNEGPVRNVIACAYYANDTLMMAEMCDAIGKTDEAASYRQRYEEIKDYFQATFLNADGTLKTENSTQTCYLMALKSDMFETEEQKQAAVDTLVQKIKDNGNKLGTGFVGTGALNQTLSDVGETNMAYTLLLQREDPSWLYSVDQGATTIWERWNSYTKENGFGDVSMNSFNHYSYGAVLEWMYSDMLGIEADIDNPGFKHIILQPQPDTREDSEIPANEQRITSVKGSYDSTYGTISAEWNWSEDEFNYTATVPANTTATVYLPTTEGQTVTVNGKDVADLDEATDGIKYIETTDGKAVFEVVSGTFNFKSSSTEEPTPGDVDKTILEKVIAKATELKGTEEYTNAIPSVKESFDKALADAQTVYDNPAATDKEVTNAWMTLMDEIHKLGFQAGDKTALQNLYDEVKDTDLSQYKDGAAKDNFKTALKNAETVLADRDAMQNEIDKAYNDLKAAFDALEKLADKSQLKALLDECAEFKEENYTPATWEVFAPILEKAQGVYDNVDATQEEVNAAVDELLGGMLQLRFKADTSILEGLVQQVEGMDLSQYTDASVAALKAVLGESKAMLGNENLSKDDQPAVDAQVEKLAQAINNLEVKDNSAVNNSTGSSTQTGSTTTTNQPVKTGDSSIVFALAATMLAGAGIIVAKKRRK